MLVVEDRDTNEVTRFFVIDAYAKLGSIQIGTDIQVFDPQRLLRYYALLENQLFDFAARYSEAFKYLPRRAYSYLSKPPLLSDITASLASSGNDFWTVDQFVIHPLTEISSKPLPRYQQKNNVESCVRWSTQTGVAPRLYNVSDLDVDSSRYNWAVSIDASALSKTMKRSLSNELLKAINHSQPIYIRIERKEEIARLLEWLVVLKDAGMPSPTIFLAVTEHRGWENELLKLLQMKGVHLLLSGATIGSLSTLINRLKDSERTDEWSKKFMYASSYPETQKGDSLTEILSFFMSRNLDASRIEIQRVLGGNMIQALAPINDRLTFEPSKSSVAAEGVFGKPAFLELLRLFRLLSTQKQLEILSAEMVTDNQGGHVKLGSIILSIRASKQNKFRKVLIQQERDESLRVIGWQKPFNVAYQTRDWVTLQTQARASVKGPVLDSPSHVGTFNRMLLDILGIRDSVGVLSSLHYGIEETGMKAGYIGLCTEDAKAIGVKEGNLVTVLDADSNHLWGAIVQTSRGCPSKRVGVSRNDLKCYGMDASSQVDIVKYVDTLSECDRVLLTYRRTLGFTNSELAAFLHMTSDEIIESVTSRIIGLGTRFVTAKGLELEVRRTAPPIRKGELSKANNAAIEIQPIEFLNELNVILVLGNGNDMLVRDVKITTPEVIRKSLDTFSKEIPEIGAFLSSMGKIEHRWSISAISALDLIRHFRNNESEGVIGMVLADNIPHKFTIQKNQELQDYIRFDSDIQNDDIFKSLVYSILDAKEISNEPTKPSILFRSIAEMLEDLGSDRPTLVILFVSRIDEIEEIIPFLQSIRSARNYKLLVFGVGNDFEKDKTEEMMKGIDAKIHKVIEYSLFEFQGSVVSAIQELCHF